LEHCCSWSETAASSTPITVALFDGLLLRKRVTLLRVLGVAGGFAGIAFLLYDGRSLATSLNPSVALGLVGVLSWGFATSLGHRFPVHGDNAVNSGIQMLFVGLVCVGGSLLLDAPPSAVLSAISPASLIAVAYLGLLGSIAFSAYTYLVSWEPAERVVSYAFVNPLIALLIGIGIGGEAPTPFLPLGVALAIAGLGLTLYGERAISLIKARKGPRG
jgi:drug/metabolite transporter (DMT)-like permease